MTIDASGGSGVSDGDKGDITVSGGGAVWTINAGAVAMSDVSGLVAALAAMQAEIDAAEADITTIEGDITTINTSLANKQPLDASLTAYAALVSAANKGLYFTGADVPALFDLSAFARTFLDDADGAAVCTTIGAADLGSNTYNDVQTVNLASGTTFLQGLSYDPGTVGAVFATYHRSPSPAANDAIARWTALAYNASLADKTIGLLQCIMLSPVAGSETGQWELWTATSGAQVRRMSVGLGAFMQGATSGDMGVGTFNASAYYDDGVALSAIYSQLGAANTHTTGKNTFTNNSADTFEIISSVADSSLKLTHAKGSAGAANDELFNIYFYGKDSANANALFAFIDAITLDPTAASKDGQIRLVPVVANVATAAFSAANGVIVGNPTGSYKGTGTVNATEYYKNGTAIVSTHEVGIYQDAKTLNTNGGTCVANTWTKRDLQTTVKAATGDLSIEQRSHLRSSVWQMASRSHYACLQHNYWHEASAVGWFSGNQ